MRNKRVITVLWNSLLSSWLVLSVSFQALAAQPTVARTVVQDAGTQFEQGERDVDQVALSALDHSAQTLSRALTRYRGTESEPQFLARLAQIQSQMAAVRFRVAHGRARTLGKAVDLKDYQAELGRCVQTLNHLITTYPHFEGIPTALALRGRSYEDAQNRKAATADYLELVSRFPNAPETIPAYMSLADFAVEAGDHALAIHYLEPVEKHPSDAHYPFALYKMAWAHYNLKHVRSSLAYTERLVSFYSRAKLASDAALLENCLQDSTVFFFEGFEEKLPGFQPQEALAYFKKLASSSLNSDASDNSGSHLGKMARRYAKLLRSHDYARELVNWKNIVLAYQPVLAERGEVLLTTLEYMRNKHSYADLVDTARDVTHLGRKEIGDQAYSEAQSLMLAAASDLQSVIMKNKDASGVAELGKPLAALYDAFIASASPGDPRIPTIHSNLAETLFAIHDYNQATRHYRWIVEQGKAPSPAIAEASLKAVSSRYESLRARGLIPVTLKPVSLGAAAAPVLRPEIAEWVKWIDAHVKLASDPIENFQYEANRCLYAQGQTRMAFERMKRFALDRPHSAFALAQATLVLDTAIQTADWSGLASLAHEFLVEKAWQNTPFGQKLVTVAGDAHYKHMESVFLAHNPEAALELSNQFFKAYPKSTHQIEALILAGNAALQTHAWDQAVANFRHVVDLTPKSETAAKALQTLAETQEARFSFGPAAQAYRELLTYAPKLTGLSTARETDFRKRILLYSWISGESNTLNRNLKDKNICNSRLKSECDRYAIIALIQDQRHAPHGLKNIHQAATSELKALWALAALSGANQLSFEDRNSIITSLARNWSKVDSQVRFAFFPRLLTVLPSTLTIQRKAVRTGGKLSEKALVARISHIHELELTVQSVTKLPWLELRNSAFEQMATAYRELSQDLASVPTRSPLAQSAHSLAPSFDKRAREWAATLPNVRDPQNPKDLQDPEINIVALRNADIQGDWRSISPQAKEIPLVLRARWSAALLAHRWPEVAYYAQESRARKLLPEDIQTLAQSVSLSLAGARHEGVEQLKTAGISVPGLRLVTQRK